MLYNGFISYSHAADGKFAPYLQSALQNFARPFCRLRALNIFRDQTSLAATPSLWPRIEFALNQANYFILLASPTAAKSRWVKQEIDHWLTIQNGSVDKFLIVLTEGEIYWDEDKGDFDWQKTNALPRLLDWDPQNHSARSLEGVFTAEPYYINMGQVKTEKDLSVRNPVFLDLVATIASTLHGKSKEDIIGENVSNHRRYLLIRNVAIALLVALAVAAVFFGGRARSQQKLAEQRGDSLIAALTSRDSALMESIKQAQIAKDSSESAKKSRFEAEKQRDNARQATVEAQKQANEAKSLYWASESDNLLQTPAIRLLQQAAFLNLDKRPIYERLFRRFNEGGGSNILFNQQDFKHQDKVYSANFSPNGKLLITSSADGTAKLWNLKGQLLTIFPHGGNVLQANFSPTGSLVATASTNGQAKLWNLKGKLIAIMPHPSQVHWVSFLPDRKHIITAGLNTKPILWNLEGLRIDTLSVAESHPRLGLDSSGNWITTLSLPQAFMLLDLQGQTITALPPMNGVNFVGIAPNGQLIVTTSKAITSIWNKKGQLLKQFSHNDEVRWARFSPNSDLVLTASFDNTAKLWDLKGNLLVTLPHGDFVRQANFSPDGNLIITASDDKLARLWNLKGKLLSTIVFKNKGNICDRSAVSHHIITIPVEKSPKLWNLKGKFIASLPQKNVVKANISLNGKFIITLASDTAKVWNLKGQLLTDLSVGDTIKWANIASNGNLIITGTSGKIAKLWNLKGRLVNILRHKGYITQASFSSNGSLIVTTSIDSTAKIWNQQGKLLKTISLGEKGRSPVFSPNSRYFATLGLGNGNGTEVYTVKLWNRQGQLINSLPHDDVVYRIKFSPNNRLVVTTSYKTAKLWDQKGFFLKDLRHDELIHWIEFSPNGEFILTASADKTVKLWNQQGMLLYTLRHLEGVKWASFTPDGSRIITSTDNTIKIWYSVEEILRWLNKNKNLVSPLSPDNEKLFMTSNFISKLPAPQRQTR